MPGAGSSVIPPHQQKLIVVVTCDVSDIVQRHVIVVVILENIIVVIEINIDIIVFQDIDFFVGFHLGLALTVFGISRDHAGLSGVNLDNFAGIWANDRIGIQVIKALASGWANTFDAPFFFGHGSSPLLRGHIDNLRQLP
jgi:hypothetical protein